LYLLYIITLILLSQVSALMQNPLDDMSEKTSLLPKIEETVWWNTTDPELNPEPYTAPFFEVYTLKNLGQGAYGLNVADFNQDQILDIAVGWWNIDDPQFYHGGISIFYGNSDNCFTIETIYIHEWDVSYLDVGDFNGDGFEDILFSQFEVIYGENGEETMDSTYIIWNDEGTFERISHTYDFRKADDWQNPHFALADFDVDGDVDFLVGANCGKVKLLYLFS